MEGKVTIPQWMQDEYGTTAGLCEYINDMLKNNPNMSLKDFAGELNETIAQLTLERVKTAEKKQFEQGGGIYAE